VSTPPLPSSTPPRSTPTGEFAAAPGYPSELERVVESTKDGFDGGGAGGVLILSDSVTLILGDCRDYIEEMKGVEAVVTDPPYPGREDLFPTESVWTVLRAVREKWPAFVFWPCVPDYPCGTPDAVHVWHKSIPIHPRSETGNVAGHQYERILSFGLGKKCEVFRVAAVIPNFAACAEELQPHPTQKPVDLYKWTLANFAKPGMRVLDTHLGSGSHAIAAHYAGIHLTACEIDADYFHAAKARIARETSQAELFSPQILDFGSQSGHGASQ